MCVRRTVFLINDLSDDVSFGIKLNDVGKIMKNFIFPILCSPICVATSSANLFNCYTYSIFIV